MSNPLTIQIRKSFQTIPYCNQQAYNSLLSGEKIVFDDLESIAEILVHHFRVAGYHRGLEHYMKSGNRTFFTPILNCLPEKNRHEFEKEFKRRRCLIKLGVGD